MEMNYVKEGCLKENSKCFNVRIMKEEAGVRYYRGV